MQFLKEKLKKVLFMLQEQEKKFYRDDGSKVQFDKNAVVLTDDKGEPIGKEYLVL